MQLRKLGGIVRRRRALAGEIARRCREELETVRVAEGPPDCEGAYWFLLLRLELPRLRVDKQTFVEALAAEGLPVGADYLFAPALADWFRGRAVFGRSGFPWASECYAGDADRLFDVPNAGRDVRLLMRFQF